MKRSLLNKFQIIHLKNLVFFLFTMIITCLLSSCNLEGVHKQQNGIVFCVNTNVSVLDPQYSEMNITSFTLAQNVFNRLVRYDEETDSFKPELSTAWKVSSDGLAYTFYLRKDVHFHTNRWFKPTRTFNADDVVYTFNRLINTSKLATPINSTQVDYINFKNLIQLNRYIKRIKKINDYTVQFVLETNNSNLNFLEFLSNPQSIILSEEYFNKISKRNYNANDYFNHIIGTGPFVLTRFKYNDFIKLERNKNYWDKQRSPKLDRLVIDITPNQAKRMSKMITNECQIANQPTDNIVLHTKFDEKFNIMKSDSIDSALLFFNVSKEPLSNVNLRRALAFAFDRETYRNTIYGTTGKATFNMFPFDQNFSPEYSFSYSQETANSLMQTYLDSIPTILTLKRKHKKDIKLNVWIESGNSKLGYNSGRIGQLIKRDLERVGIKAQISELSRKSLKNLIEYRGYDIIILRQTFSRNIPFNRLYNFFSCNKEKPTKTNLSTFCNNSLIENLTKVQYSQIIEENYPIFDEINNVLLTYLPYLPITYASDSYVYNTDIMGVKRNSNNGIDFSGVFVQRNTEANE